MVVEGDMEDLEPALAVEGACYYRARMACCRAVRPAVRRPANTVRVAAVQDMYMGIAGY